MMVHAVRRDLTDVMLRLVAQVSGFHYESLFKRALISSFLVVALGLVLGACDAGGLPSSDRG
jgi:hypothetical protein